MTPSPFDRISARLGALRRQLDRRDAGEAAWAATICASLGLSSGLGLAMLLPGAWGLLGWLPLSVGLFAALSALWVLGVQTRRRRATDAALARWLESRSPSLRSGLITAVQVGDALETNAAWPGLHEGLARRSASEAWATFRTLDLEALVDKRRLALLMRWGLLSLLLTLALSVYHPATTRLAVKRLIGVGGEQGLAQGPIREVTTLVNDLALTLEFPNYVNRQRRHIPRTGGDFSAIQGTRVTVTGQSSEPLSAMVLELESDPGSRWSVELGQSGMMRTQLEVGTSDRYRFLGLTTTGQLLREGSWRVVDARSDDIPSVRLLLPERDLEINPSDQVPMVFEASDDHGLGLIELVIQPLTGGEVTRRTLRDAGGEKQANGATNLEVEGLRLLAGEAVDVWFEASDLKGGEARAKGRSQSRRVTIYSPEAEHAERLTEISAIIEALITLLAERLESPISESASPELQSVVSAQLSISRATHQVVRGLEALMGAMSTDTLASQGMLDGVRKLLDALSAHYEGEEAQLRQVEKSRGAERRPRQILKVIAAQNDEGVEILEAGAWALKKLVEEARQRQILAQGRDLLDAQETLMAEIAQMKARGENTLSVEARRSLDELEATLRRMEEELGQLIERSPYENQNLSSEASDDEEDVQSLRERLEQVKQLLAEGKHDEATKLMEELQRETQELLAALQGDFNLQAPQEETSQALSDFDLKLGELTSEQAGLNTETEEEERRLSAEEQAAQKAQLQEAMNDALKLARELEGASKEVKSNPLHSSDREALEALQGRAQATREAVEMLNPELARERSERFKRASGDLKREVSHSEARATERGHREELQQVVEGLGGLEELAEKLEQALDEVRPQETKPSAERRRGANRLAKRQGGLKSALEALEGRLESLDAELPGLGESLQPKMERVKDAMRSAREELGEVQPGEASTHQRRALSELGAMKEAIDKRVQDASGRGGGGAGINRRDQKVEIPKGLEHSPKALRDALLKAMKERAPERYEEAIERYYEELVR